MSRPAHARAIAAAASFSVENLEQRRMLSAASNYVAAEIITDTSPAGGRYQLFGGSALAVSGNLALIGSTGKFVSTAITDAAGQETGENIDTTEGHVSLVELSDGSIIHTFTNDPVLTGSQFGASGVFVGGKIAIGAPGIGKIFIYDPSDYHLIKTYVAPNVATENASLTGFGAQLAADGNDLLASVSQKNLELAANGAIYRYDLGSASTDQAATYALENSSGYDQLGSRMVCDGQYIYATSNLTYDDPNVPGLTVQESDVEVFNAATGALVNTFHSLPNEQLFGFAMATYQDPIAGPTVMIGSNAQRAVFQLTPQGQKLKTFTLPADAAGVQSLAISDDTLLIGDASRQKEFATGFWAIGGAYVYDITSGGQTATIEDPNQTIVNYPVSIDLGDEMDAFGFAATGLTGGKFLITSPNANSGNPLTLDPNNGGYVINDSVVDTGAAYVYAPSLTPIDVLDDMLSEIQALNLQQGVTSSVTSKLQAVAHLLGQDAGNDTSVAALLDAVMNGVSQWYAKGKINQDLYDQLISQAQWIKTSVLS